MLRQDSYLLMFPKLRTLRKTLDWLRPKVVDDSTFHVSITSQVSNALDCYLLGITLRGSSVQDQEYHSELNSG